MFLLLTLEKVNADWDTTAKQILKKLLLKGIASFWRKSRQVFKLTEIDIGCFCHGCKDFGTTCFCMLKYYHSYLKLSITALYLFCTCSEYDWCMFIFTYALKGKQNSKKLHPFFHQVEELSPIFLDLECDISRYLFPHLWSSSSCDAIPTFKIFDQIDPENTEKVINRISYFKKILPMLYMLKKC